MILVFLDLMLNRSIFYWIYSVDLNYTRSNVGLIYFFVRSNECSSGSCSSGDAEVKFDSFLTINYHTKSILILTSDERRVGAETGIAP